MAEDKKKKRDQRHLLLKEQGPPQPGARAIEFEEMIPGGQYLAAVSPAALGRKGFRALLSKLKSVFPGAVKGKTKKKAAKSLADIRKEKGVEPGSASDPEVVKAGKEGKKRAMRVKESPRPTKADERPLDYSDRIRGAVRKSKDEE